MALLAYSQPNQHWLIKYKLYHIPFWIVYHYTWWVIGIGNPVKAANTIFLTPFALKFLFYLVFQALAVYFNLYYLMPKYLEKSRFTHYITYLLITILCTALLIIPGYYTSAYLSGQTLDQAFGKGACFFGFFGNTLPSTIASTTLAMSIKLTKNWIQTKRRQQLLEKENLESELKFLRHQFNPHFLFNTINSIFFLIHKNPDMASNSLAKFSELLRYQLYECNDVQIPLSKEISYLENFIELEKLRQNNNMVVTVDLHQQQSHSLCIAPFILMTFVENAFKHVSTDAHTSNWIKVQLQVNDKQLDFCISNSTSGYKPNDVVHYGGIGLKNVQRRLDLLYPGKYELDIQSNENSFSVQFRLQLPEVVTHDRTEQLAIDDQYHLV
jgi:two-component system LytT family sensor kinase